jgi:hypothetical protein
LGHDSGVDAGINEKGKNVTDKEFIKYMKENINNPLVRNNRDNVSRMVSLWRLFL